MGLGERCSNAALVAVNMCAVCERGRKVHRDERRGDGASGGSYDVSGVRA